MRAAPDAAVQDYYRLLGVSKTATDAEITRAFRRLARRLHPDTGARADDGDRFDRVAVAYRILHNAERRREYDRVCKSERVLDVPNRVLRAATYARQSKAREDDSAGSPTAQKESTAALVAARGWQFVGHYEDLGRSGYDPKAKRPGLEALLAAVRRREVDLVVVYRLDRLTRQGVVEAVRLVGELDAYDAALASVNEPFLDTTSAMGRGIFGLFAAMAEQESENISQRTKATKEILRRAGSFAGGQRPYGYRLAKESRDGLTITVLRRDEKETGVVADVVARVLAGASVTSEAKRLNAEGIKSSTGKEWGVATLSRLLKSPTLAGYKATTRGGLVLDEDGSPIQSWEPVIDPHLWYELQDVLASRRGGRGPRPLEPTLLGGFDIFRCASCGGRMAGDRRSDGRGTYRCALHRRGSSLCKGAAVAMRQADNYVARAVWDRLRDLDLSEAEDRYFFTEVARRYATHKEPDRNGRPHAAWRRLSSTMPRPHSPSSTTTAPPASSLAHREPSATAARCLRWKRVPRQPEPRWPRCRPWTRPKMRPPSTTC